MKLLLAMCLVSCAALSAFAAKGGDQYEVIYNCGPAVVHPDLDMNLQILEGGFAGKTTIRTIRYFLGHSQADNYFVNLVPPAPHRMGAPTVYKGNGITFTINLTTTPGRDGKRVATLKTKQYGVETLVCERK